MQKAGIVTQKLAQELIGMEIGDRISTVEDMATRYNAGRGTVQQALAFLREQEALRLEAHGHLGTNVSYINYSKLMEICSSNNLVGVMPLPYSRRYEGLATGIYSVLNDNTGVSVNLAFMGGSDRRLNALLEGRYNFAIMSYVTARHYISENKEVEISHILADHTYVNEHTLILSKDFTEEPRRIGVDRSSFDQMSMTANYFQNRQIELVPLKYGHIIDNIKNGVIDATIWSLEEAIINDPELRYESITGNGVALDNTKAAIVVRREDVTVRNYLARFLDTERVQFIQQQVLQSKVLPNY